MKIDTVAELHGRLTEAAEELSETWAITRNLAGDRCGEAVDRIVEVRRLVRECREILLASTGEGPDS